MWPISLNQNSQHRGYFKDWSTAKKGVALTYTGKLINYEKGPPLTSNKNHEMVKWNVKKIESYYPCFPFKKSPTLLSAPVFNLALSVLAAILFSFK